MIAAGIEAVLPSSLRRLLWIRTTAKLTRLKSRMLVPRRMLMNGIVLMLGIFWLGQTLASIFMRPAADPERLRTWITSGLVLYAYWHLLRSVWNKDLEGVQWSRPERELLWTAPFSRVQLVSYRLAGMIGPALLKAALLTAVLIPDSARLEFTFLGLFLALMVLELTRMTAELVCWGVSGRKATHLRWGITSIAIGILAAIGISVWSRWHTFDHSMPAIQLPNMILSGLIDLGDSPVAWALGFPLRYIADIATAGGFTFPAVLGMLVAGCEITGLIAFVFWLERRMTEERHRHQQTQYELLEIDSVDDHHALQNQVRFSNRKRLTRLSQNQGLGPLIARHLETLKKYWTTVVVTLAIPAGFSMFPIWVLPSDQPVLLHVVGSLVFYTLLLGPAALKIDFRRDLDRLIPLRQLPISALRVVAGQLAVPVICCLSFHALVLTATMIVRPSDFSSLLLSVAVLVPMTILIFAIENAIFLAFPQRIGQEGIEVLIRTTLVFVFKGMMFAFGVAIMLGWALITKQFVAMELQPYASRAGSLLMLWSVTAMAVYLTSVGFKRFDLSVDTPAA